MPRPALLCILDGWGWRADPADNAIAAAKTPNYTRLLAECPHALLQTSGRAVGLPTGQMGNSEVGHMNIGAGRVVAQDLPRIDFAIEDGTLASRPALVEIIAKVKASRGAVHLMGLLSPGGVHSHQDHMAALAKIISAAGVPVLVHAFLDGRDTPPKSARGFLEKFAGDTKGCAGMRLATLSGRYYAMDRDKRWDRVEKCYAAMVDASARRFDDAFAALEASYDEDLSDEFVVPAVLGDYAGMADGDALLFANFRADRAREISLALLDAGFSGFPRTRIVKFSTAAGMTEYSEELKFLMTALFPAQDVRETLGEVIAEHHLKQLRIAETEKYAHVTFFLNAGREEPFAGEDRILIPSPRVSTYDHKPEMSAYQVTDRLVEAIESNKYDLIVCNYANPDMVGHTGIMSAAIKAVDTIDECLGRLVAAIAKAKGFMLLTADHGNIELMKDQETGEPFTAHTTFDVPILLFGAPGIIPGGTKLDNGRLADIAPTMLALMGVAQPSAMTGHSLLVGVPAKKGKRLSFLRKFFLVLAALPSVLPALAATQAQVPVPRPRPALKSDAPSQTPEPPMDLSHALPSQSLAGLPSSQQQLGTLNAELAKNRPAVADAKAKAAALANQAASLRKKLIDTAARIQALEREQNVLAGQIIQLHAEDDALAGGFARDRISVTRLLAILERLQHDTPPALVVRPDDALAAARGAMLVGASLPPVYAEAASLARRIEKLNATRAALGSRKLDAAKTAASLVVAHADLAGLSAQKDREAAGAADRYSGMAARLDQIAHQAADFAALVTRVDALRRAGPSAPQASIVTVTAQNTGSDGGLTKGSLLEPVAGTLVPGGAESDKNPGLTYATGAGAQVIAPADGKVLFAGPYHKEGQVLILEITTGYDIVLSGLGRVTVRLGDELLAGEPVGIMPADSPGTRLYFELRQNGKGLDPEPWLTKAKKA